MSKNNNLPRSDYIISDPIISRVLVACLLGLLVGCGSSSSDPPKLLLWEHQLVGKVWDIKQRAFIDQATLINKVLDSEYLLLGEHHDNLVHHQHQAWMIHQLAKARRQASVSFEMIDNEQAERLAKLQISSADQLITVLDRSKTSWNYEVQYKSLFAEVLAAGYRIDSANLNSKQLMHTVMQGEDKLPADYKRMVNNTSFSALQLKALKREIDVSHCNMLDDKTLRSMVLGQRLRDAVMAHSLLRSQAQVKVLIAGSGHVRKYRAVPMYLRANLHRQASDASILTIGLIEVETGKTDVSGYVKRWGGNTLPFDIVWFTPKVKREDPCAELRRHFKK